MRHEDKILEKIICFYFLTEKYGSHDVSRLTKAYLEHVWILHTKVTE